MAPITVQALVQKLKTYFMSATGDTQMGGNITPDADKAYNIGSPSRRLNVIYADTVDANVSAGTLSGSTWSHPGDMTIDPKVDNTTTTLFVLNSGVGGVANLNVENDIVVGGLVDGVDIASLKSSYDSHVASADSHHSAFVGLKDDTGNTISPDASDLIQIVGGNGLSSTAGAGTLTLSVNVGDGIQIVSDAVAVDSTVVRTSRQVVAGQGLVGGGPLSADVTLDVNVGAGLQIVSDAVRVNQGYSFNWSAIHNWGSGVSVDPAGAVSAPGSLRINIDSDNNTTNAALIFGKDGSGTSSTEIGRINESGDLSVSRDIRTGRYYLTPAGDVWVRFTDELSGDASYIGAGGLTVIGGGESASAVLSGGGIDGSSERLILASDVTGASEAIRFVTSLQNGWAGRVDAMSILGDGRVGIGTLTPNVQLDVVGSVKISNALDVNGAADIAEDLTVGAAYSTPGVLFVDVSQQNVGINRAPDNQFALDVSGPARADWWVGPHALQLSDARMIVHFDGPLPYNKDFSGFSVGHAGQVSTEVGGVIYKEGKFGKAVQLADGTINLIPNPSFERDGILLNAHPYRWLFVLGYGGVTEYGVTDRMSLYGDFSAYHILDGTATATTGIVTERITDSSIAGGADFTFSCWVYPVDSDVSINAIIRCYDSSGGFIADIARLQNASAGQWNLVWVTGTLPSGTAGVACQVRVNAAYIGKIYYDGAQLENKSYMTPYCDGSLSDQGHYWYGIPHESKSGRNGAYIRWDKFRWDGPWTITMWTQPFISSSASDSSTTTRFLQIGPYYTDPSLSVMRWYSVNNAIAMYFRDYTPNTGWTDYRYVGMQWDPLDWLFIAVVHDGSQITLYVYNHTKGTFSSGSITNLGDGFGDGPLDLYIPNSSQSNSSTGKGLFDDLAILDRAASADEIRAIYESNAPVFAESSVFAFRVPSSSPIWVDDEGLWVRSKTGNDAFAIYAGESGASKTWGGRTLYDSDVMIGNATAGYLHWHAGVDSADTQYYNSPLLEVSGQVHIKDDSTIDGVVTLGIYGGIYQGTGSFNSPDTGLKLWNYGGIGRIAGFNNGKVQWEGATDGKFKAGNGDIVLDEAGITLYTSASSAGLIKMVTPDTSTIKIFGNDDANSAWLIMESVAAGTKQGIIKLYAYNSARTKQSYININSGTSTVDNTIDIYATTVTVNASSLRVGSFDVWHAGNDGSGSGLDADLLDGYHASQFWRPDNDGTGSGLDADLLDGYHASQFWRPDNDGSGSGLDADLLDGYDSSAFWRLADTSAKSISGRANFVDTSAASLSTDGAITIGPTSGLNITLDQDEIQARNNGVISSFYINRSGGNVQFGDTSNRSDLYLWDVYTYQGGFYRKLGAIQIGDPIQITSGQNWSNGLDVFDTYDLDGSFGVPSGIRYVFVQVMCRINEPVGTTGAFAQGYVEVGPTSTSTNRLSTGLVRIETDERRNWGIVDVGTGVTLVVHRYFTANTNVNYFWTVNVVGWMW